MATARFCKRSLMLIGTYYVLLGNKKTLNEENRLNSREDIQAEIICRHYK